MTDISQIIVVLIVFFSIFVAPVAGIAWILVSLIKSRSRERTDLIHQRIEPTYKKPAPNRYTTLRNGCLCIGLAIGLIMGILISLQVDYREEIYFLIVSASTVLFLGIGYIVFFLLVKNKNLDEE